MSIIYIEENKILFTSSTGIGTIYSGSTGMDTIYSGGTGTDTVFTGATGIEAIFTPEIIKDDPIIQVQTPFETGYAIDINFIYAQDTNEERAKAWQIIN